MIIYDPKFNINFRNGTNSQMKRKNAHQPRSDEMPHCHVTHIKNYTLRQELTLIFNVNDSAFNGVISVINM